MQAFVRRAECYPPFTAGIEQIMRLTKVMISKTCGYLKNKKKEQLFVATKIKKKPRKKDHFRYSESFIRQLIFASIPTGYFYTILYYIYWYWYWLSYVQTDMAQWTDNCLILKKIIYSKWISLCTMLKRTEIIVSNIFMNHMYYTADTYILIHRHSLKNYLNCKYWVILRY